VTKACPGALRSVALEGIILPEWKINHLSAACLCVLARRQVLAQAGHHLVWARVKSGNLKLEIGRALKLMIHD